MTGCALDRVLLAGKAAIVGAFGETKEDGQKGTAAWKGWVVIIPTRSPNKTGKEK